MPPLADRRPASTDLRAARHWPRIASRVLRPVLPGPPPRRWAHSAGHLLLIAALLFPVASATALPADVLLVVDTSRSMGDDAGGQTKLELAKSIAAQIADVAGGRHRVGLIQFAQLAQVVDGGEGPATVHMEDPQACVRMADLLVPLTATGAAEAARWLDGDDAPGEPELAAAGDSPLVGTLQLAFDYLRARRVEDPLHACVNTYVVVLTDGKDTCAGAGDVTSGLMALAATADAEAIRVLVLSFDPTGETSALLAGIGAQGAAAQAFAPDEAAQLVALIAAIEGHPTPEACVASGVPAEVFSGTGTGTGTDTDTGTDTGPDAAGGDGCSARGRAPNPSMLLVFGLALALASRRRIGCGLPSRRALALVSRRRTALALLLALAGCSSDPAPGAATATDAADTAIVDAALPDPAEEAAADLLRVEAVAAEAARLRAEVLAPVLDPETVFASLSADPMAGCLALARSVGLEAYEGAQRGPAGCLATRRCNPKDKALLLQACLGANGINAQLTTCGHTAEIDAALADALLEPPALPDVAPMDAALAAAIDTVTAGDPKLGEAARLLGPAAKQGVDEELAYAVEADMALLQQFFDALSPEATAEAAASVSAEALDTYAFLVKGNEVLDPTFEDSPAALGCDHMPVNPAATHALVTLRLLVQYAEPVSPRNGIELLLMDEVTAGEVTFAPAEHWGETVTLAIAGAAASTIEPGLPAPAPTGCMRPLFRVGAAAPMAGDPFFIGVGELCPEPPVVPIAEGRHLASVTLEVDVTLPDQAPQTFRRALTNRYGYVSSLGGLISGPMYSAESARSLLAMRVDLPVVAGLPIAQAFADAQLADIVAREDENLARMREVFGVPSGAAPPGPPLPIAWAMLGHFASHLPALVPDGATVSFDRPWLLALVQRRGFGVGADSGLTLEGQLILDVLDAPVRIDARGGDPVARLAAQVRVGVLLTESERLAMAGFAGTPAVVNAGLMLRDPGTGDWGTWGSAGHEPELFPRSVREAAAETEATLLVTPGPVSFLDGEYAAWWRLDPSTGQVLGEVQLDGTFYGGAAAGDVFGKTSKQGVKLIADVNRCLWCTAAMALEGVEFDNEKCLADAVSTNGMDLAFKLGSKAAFGVTICNFAGLNEPGRYLVDMAFENLPGLSSVKDLYDIAKMAKKFKTPCDAYIK